jgi:hypothetical protein
MPQPLQPLTAEQTTEAPAVATYARTTSNASDTHKNNNLGQLSSSCDHQDEERFATDRAGHRMKISTYPEVKGTYPVRIQYIPRSDLRYAQGWYCDKCASHGTAGSERWFCKQCKCDICFKCIPPNVAPAGSGGVEYGSEVILFGGSEFNAGGKRESTQTTSFDQAFPASRFDTIRVGAQVPDAPTRRCCLEEWWNSPNPLKQCVACVVFGALVVAVYYVYFKIK